jgi:hypothetical protein
MKAGFVENSLQLSDKVYTEWIKRQHILPTSRSGLWDFFLFPELTAELKHSVIDQPKTVTDDLRHIIETMDVMLYIYYVTKFISIGSYTAVNVMGWWADDYV